MRKLPLLIAVATFALPSTAAASSSGPTIVPTLSNADSVTTGQRIKVSVSLATTNADYPTTVDLGLHASNGFTITKVEGDSAITPPSDYDPPATAKFAIPRDDSIHKMTVTLRAPSKAVSADAVDPLDISIKSTTTVDADKVAVVKPILRFEPVAPSFPGTTTSVRVSLVNGSEEPWTDPLTPKLTAGALTTTLSDSESAVGVMLDGFATTAFSVPVPSDGSTPSATATATAADPVVQRLNLAQKPTLVVDEIPAFTVGGSAKVTVTLGNPNQDVRAPALVVRLKLPDHTTISSPAVTDVAGGSVDGVVWSVPGLLPNQSFRLVFDLHADAATADDLVATVQSLGRPQAIRSVVVTGPADLLPGGTPPASDTPTPMPTPTLASVPTPTLPIVVPSVAQTLTLDFTRDPFGPADDNPVAHKFSYALRILYAGAQLTSAQCRAARLTVRVFQRPKGKPNGRRRELTDGPTPLPLKFSKSSGDCAFSIKATFPKSFAGKLYEYAFTVKLKKKLHVAGQADAVPATVTAAKYVTARLARTACGLCCPAGEVNSNSRRLELMALLI